MLTAWGGWLGTPAQLPVRAVLKARRSVLNATRCVSQHWCTAQGACASHSVNKVLAQGCVAPASRSSQAQGKLRGGGFACSVEGQLGVHFLRRGLETSQKRGPKKRRRSTHCPETSENSIQNGTLQLWLAAFGDRTAGASLQLEMLARLGCAGRNRGSV